MPPRLVVQVKSRLRVSILNSLILCNWQLNSQNKGGCLHNTESAWRGAASGLSVDTRRVQSCLQLGCHGLPARLQPLTLHAVRGVAEHLSKVLLTQIMDLERHNNYLLKFCTNIDYMSMTTSICLTLKCYGSFTIQSNLSFTTSTTIYTFNQKIKTNTK